MASTQEKMIYLIDKWNPLFDPGARKNLVEDVNSFIRDSLRAVNRRYKLNIPEKKRIQNLADTLANNKNLSEIKEKLHLKSYIEIYIIKSLQKKA